MPDLNSIPQPPPSTGDNRRSISIQNRRSQVSSPSAPISPTLNLLPSNQQALHHAAAGSLPSTPLSAMHPPPAAPGQDNTGVGNGPGPIRHPRPLTAAELHSQLEQEQELLVNRLTRDLSLLRAAHNSSVASNNSSASASTSADPTHPSSFTDTHLLSGPGFPIPTSADRRHNRTNSSASARSLSHAATQGSNTPAPIPIPQSHSGNAASVLEAARNPRGAPGMSRQNSTASHRSTSRTQSPAPFLSGSFGPSSYTQSYGYLHEYSPSYFPRGPSSGTGPGPGPGNPGHTPSSNNQSIAATPGSSSSEALFSPGLMPATVRYEETAHFRAELEAAKRENDTLKRRIKDLEATLRSNNSRKHSDAASSRAGGRGRSESASTTASVSVSGATGVGGLVGGGAGIAPDRREQRRGLERDASAMSVAGSVGVGVPEEELKVGESAASAGLGTRTAATTAAGAGAESSGQAQTQPQTQPPETK
ncbi:hypothetical protein F5B20DRAFT_495485 [Whalleya microplaca]|nr:hypothetical protein F5B20DRAFT_495485 [Whalleya microplaca]